MEITRENRGIQPNGVDWIYQAQDQYNDRGKLYEQYNDTFKKYENFRDEFDQLTQKEQDNIINEIFEIYRGVNIYPIVYYTKEGYQKEIMKLYNRQDEYDGKILKNNATLGVSLCNWTHPIAHTIYRLRNNDCLLDRFYDDTLLKRAIRGALRTRRSVAPCNVRGIMTLMGATPSNFKPFSAQLVIERYTPTNGVYFDSSQGLGGRLLGCLTSQKNIKYIGVDPWREANICNNKLGQYCEETLCKSNSYKLFQIGSEKAKFSNEAIADFSFTSPPYFDCEQYTDDPTQCYIAYPQLSKWISNFCGMTIKNTYNILKPGAFYVVDIADFMHNKVKFNYIDTWKTLALQVGFEYINTSYMMLSPRVGNYSNVARKRDVDHAKLETMLVFRKPLDMNNFANNVKVEVDY
jgi:hypothetical protein